MSFPRIVLMGVEPFVDTHAGTSTYRDVETGQHLFSLTGKKSRWKWNYGPET